MDDYHSRRIGNELCLSLETTLIFPSRVCCVIIIYKEISLVEDRAGCVLCNYDYVEIFLVQEMNMTCVWRRRKCFFREQILGVFERNEANHQCAEERSYCKRSINFYDIYISI